MSFYLVPYGEMVIDGPTEYSKFVPQLCMHILDIQLRLPKGD